MNKKLVSLMAAALALLSARGQVSFTGYGDHQPIEITLSNNQTSLNKVYVLYDTDGVGMTFTARSGDPVVWQTYETRASIYEDVTGIRHEGMVTTLDQVIPNKGYIITEGTTPFYCWVVNYADYALELNDMFINNEAPCNLLTFNIDGHGDAIPYYEINGQRHVLDREIQLTYDNETFEWDGPIRGHWESNNVVETFAALDQGIEIAPPLCDTEFSLSGDRFLKEWGLELEGIGPVSFTTKAVGCVSVAVPLDKNGEPFRDEQGNETKLEGELSGGSAPVRILFTGYPSDAVVYRRWDVATDAEFENVILQFNQDDVDYTFNDPGNYYVRYMVANQEGSCEAYGDVYTINVSESSLGAGPRGDLPNVFSPGTTPGTNDVWKVPHKSIVEFHCWIYNRWGNLLYEFTDPDGGWDGTYHGKLVDTGVYYYVVTATGSDGVNYKKRGAISIMRYKGYEGSGEVAP